MLNLYRRRGFLPLGHALQADVDEGYLQIFGLAERTQERSVSHRRCDRDSGSPPRTSFMRRLILPCLVLPRLSWPLQP
jgi:hypothetical protein